MVCPVCRCDISSVVDLSSHLRRDLRYFPWECSLCPAKFLRVQDADFHFSSPASRHPGQRPSYIEQFDEKLELEMYDLEQRHQASGSTRAITFTPKRPMSILPARSSAMPNFIQAESVPKTPPAPVPPVSYYSSPSPVRSRVQDHSYSPKTFTLAEAESEDYWSPEKPTSPEAEPESAMVVHEGQKETMHSEPPHFPSSVFPPDISPSMNTGSDLCSTFLMKCAFCNNKIPGGNRLSAIRHSLHHVTEDFHKCHLCDFGTRHLKEMAVHCEHYHKVKVPPHFKEDLSQHLVACMGQSGYEKALQFWRHKDRIRDERRRLKAKTSHSI